MNSPHLLLLFLLSLFAIGCSDGRPDRVPVSGQVLIDGKPLTCGGVTFIPDGHRASHGTIGHWRTTVLLTLYPVEPGS